MKEGQTQEPVGGMKTLPSIDESGVIAVRISENIKPELTAKEQALFIAGFQECVKYLNESAPIKTEGEDEIPNAPNCYNLYESFIWQDGFKAGQIPPPSPVGIDVEALANDYVKTLKITNRNEIEYAIQDFKAGYSASLPSSSGEEEKVEIIDGYTQLMVDRRSLPKDGQRIKFMTENENWYEGYFVGGDDIFHVSDSQFFFKWHVQQWKAI